MASLNPREYAEKQGFLRRITTSGAVRNWLTRWIVLFDGHIYFYKTEVSPSWVMNLEVESVEKREEWKPNFKGAYLFVKNKIGRDIFFRAQTNEERDEWFDAIQMSLSGFVPKPAKT
mmetsp:Transcript_21708/g.29834  ORF Transcript_21708/g.29834 Transcript_21708/m.29834 type:complete len:117 (+) Transcript_21708:104-454(+)